MNEETATCRSCGMELIGKPYYCGGPAARHPKTGKECSISHYGGYICSPECDREATGKMKVGMDIHNDPLGYYS